MQTKTKIELVGKAIFNLYEPFTARDVGKETGLHPRGASTILRYFEDELDREEVSRSYGYRYLYRLKETESKKLKMKTRQNIRDILMYLTQENLDKLYKTTAKLRTNQIVPERGDSL